MPETAQPHRPTQDAGTANDRALLVPIALWFGLLTGLAEVVLRALRKQLLGRFSQVGHQVVWMAPLADLMIFGALGVLTYLVARKLDNARALRLAITAYAFVSALTILMMYYPLSTPARFVLAAGIAIQAGRLGLRKRAWFIRTVQVSLAWPAVVWSILNSRLHSRRGASPSEMAPDRRDFLVGVGATLGVLAAGVHGPPLIKEWWGVSALPPVKPTTPNILLLVLDTVRAASLSLHGYHRDTTPNLSRFADRGVTFTRAYSHSPWTLPAHGSLFTGCYPHELSGTWQAPLDSSYPTIAEVLTAAGYRTAGFVANTNYCSYESGLDRGFLRYEDFAVSPGEFVNSSVLANSVGDLRWFAARRHFEILGRRHAPSISRRFLAWVGDDRDHPFFAFLNYFEAHAPYLPPRSFEARFGASPDRPNPRHLFGWNWTAEQQAAEQTAYDASITYLDSELGELFTELERRGVLANTLVIVTSDHGELFGEHGLMDHANSLYIPLLHVPLLMMWPGQIPSGLTVHEAVGLRHVAATALDLAGVETAGLRGQSLAPLWRTREPNRRYQAEPILSSLRKGIRVDAHWRNANADLHSLIVGDRHYIQNSEGLEELYDLAADPGETMNIAHAADVETFRSTLERLLREGSRSPG